MSKFEIPIPVSDLKQFIQQPEVAKLLNEYCEIVWVPSVPTNAHDVLRPDSPTLPVYKTNGSAGADICAFIDSPIRIMPHQRAVIPTGWRAVIPHGFEIQIRPRSGAALHEGLTILNTPGTIDSDYTGEIKVILYNSSDQLVIIHDGDRIAQCVVQHLPSVHFSLGTEADIPVTERADGGFGSTGKN